MPIVQHGYSPRANRDSHQRQRNRAIIKANATHCHLCGTAFQPGDHIEADHIRRVSEGGNDTLTNLRPTHRTCNRRRA